MLAAHYSAYGIRAQRVCICPVHCCMSVYMYAAHSCTLLPWYHCCSVTVCQGRWFKRVQGLTPLSRSIFFFLSKHLPVILTAFTSYFLNQPNDHLMNLKMPSPFLPLRHPQVCYHMRGRCVWHHPPTYRLRMSLCGLIFSPFLVSFVLFIVFLCS